MFHNFKNPFPPAMRRGAMLPLVAVALVLLFVAALLSVDVARMVLVRSELRTATDAAARAGMEALSREENEAAAFAAAIEVASLNQVAGTGLDLEQSDITLGASTQQPNNSFNFVSASGIRNINAIKVDGSRANVRTFFGGLFGRREFSTNLSATATRLDRDIALVLDVSGSMRKDGRFEALQKAVAEFFTQLSNTSQRELVSLSVYSTESRKLVPLTRDFAALQNALAQEAPQGRTSIGEGLRDGLETILEAQEIRNFTRKSIVLMTDGNHNRGISPGEVATNEVLPEGIPINTITFSDGANQTRMQIVARRSGGQHFHAATDQDLIEAFAEIARSLNVIQIE